MVWVMEGWAPHPAQIGKSRACAGSPGGGGACDHVAVLRIRCFRAFAVLFRAGLKCVCVCVWVTAWERGVLVMAGSGASYLASRRQVLW